MDKSETVLVTGATGYIGGRLVPALVEEGYRVRVLVRDASRIEGRPWADDVEVFVGDLLKPDTLERALDGVSTAYYLVHSMYGGKGFMERDRESARNFVRAGSSLRHVIYLGGLIPEAHDVSAHLASRREVGEILRAGLPVTEFRAGPIIGSGSASFEMVRYLTERLPVMTAPRWIENEVEPIAVGDVLKYLTQALERKPLGVIDIGGDRLTFRDMMQGYAKVRGLRRTIITVPVLAPKLALWVGLVTPISNSLAVPLIEGIIHPVVGNTERAEELFPEINPLPYIQSVYTIRRDCDIPRSRRKDSNEVERHSGRRIILFYFGAAGAYQGEKKHLRGQPARSRVQRFYRFGRRQGMAGLGMGLAFKRFYGQAGRRAGTQAREETSDGASCR